MSILDRVANIFIVSKEATKAKQELSARKKYLKGLQAQHSKVKKIKKALKKISKSLDIGVKDLEELDIERYVKETEKVFGFKCSDIEKERIAIDAGILESNNIIDRVLEKKPINQSAIKDHIRTNLVSDSIVASLPNSTKTLLDLYAKTSLIIKQITPEASITHPVIRADEDNDVRIMEALLSNSIAIKSSPKQELRKITIEHVISQNQKKRLNELKKQDTMIADIKGFIMESAKLLDIKIDVESTSLKAYTQEVSKLFDLDINDHDQFKNKINSNLLDIEKAVNRMIFIYGRLLDIHPTSSKSKDPKSPKPSNHVLSKKLSINNRLIAISAKVNLLQDLIAQEASKVLNRKMKIIRQADSLYEVGNLWSKGNNLLKLSKQIAEKTNLHVSQRNSFRIRLLGNSSPIKKEFQGTRIQVSNFALMNGNETKIDDGYNLSNITIYNQERFPEPTGANYASFIFSPDSEITLESNSSQKIKLNGNKLLEGATFKLKDGDSMIIAGKKIDVFDGCLEVDNKLYANLYGKLVLYCEDAKFYKQLLGKYKKLSDVKLIQSQDIGNCHVASAISSLIENPIGRYFLTQIVTKRNSSGDIVLRFPKIIKGENGQEQLVFDEDPNLIISANFNPGAKNQVELTSSGIEFMTPINSAPIVQYLERAVGMREELIHNKKQIEGIGIDKPLFYKKQEAEKFKQSTLGILDQAGRSLSTVKILTGNIHDFGFILHGQQVDAFLDEASLKLLFKKLSIKPSDHLVLLLDSKNKKERGDKPQFRMDTGLYYMDKNKVVTYKHAYNASKISAYGALILNPHNTSLKSRNSGFVHLNEFNKMFERMNIVDLSMMMKHIPVTADIEC